MQGRKSTKLFGLVHVFAFVTIGATASAQGPTSTTTEPLIQRDRARLTLAGAQLALAAGRQQAAKIGVDVNLAVVDDGGHLLAFARMDGARPGSVYTSITKAASAATKRAATGPLPSADAVNVHLSLAVENAATVSGGKFTTLKGGVPIVIDNQVIGAIGVGGATGEQDAEVAQAAVAALTTAVAESPRTSNRSRAEMGSNAFAGNSLVEDIASHAMIDNVQTTIQCDPDGAALGNDRRSFASQKKRQM